MLPQILVKYGIPFHTLKQSPGDYVFTFPGAFHMVMNGGENFAEAINLINRKWLKHADKRAMFSCPKHAAIEEIAKNFDLPKK